MHFYFDIDDKTLEPVRDVFQQYRGFIIGAEGLQEKGICQLHDIVRSNEHNIVRLMIPEIVKLTHSKLED